jgi:hypothetical protein
VGIQDRNVDNDFSNATHAHLVEAFAGVAFRLPPSPPEHVFPRAADGSSNAMRTPLCTWQSTLLAVWF